jgi:FdrA protein
MSPQQSVLVVQVFPRLYRDSVTLMALASQIEKREGVTRVGAMMATPANLEILGRSDMLPAGLATAPDDLVITVRAVDAPTAQAALAEAADGLTVVEQAASHTERARPATVSEGMSADPTLTVAAVSTPGVHAPVVVEQALDAGLHVFCFSDNVSRDDELRLKRIAVDRGLLLMGPDCGTAVLDGVPLGFANVLSPGPVAIVAASGTGAQEVSCLLDRAGLGICQLVGVGGRDLSAQIGGLTTGLALDLVATDEATRVVVVVSKPPAPQVADRLLAKLASLGTPAVACLVGQEDAQHGTVAVRGTLEGAALAVAALLGHRLEIESAPPPPRSGPPLAPGILGLYTGGTLAAEAEGILARLGATAEILDLGDDQYTTGRPHPMIDPSTRAEHVAAAGGRADVGVLLLDLVLGHGAAADPATPLAAAVAEARAVAAADGRRLEAVASVCGTAGDPQGLPAQREILRSAGVRVLPTNAAAARYAAALAGTSSPTARERS